MNADDIFSVLPGAPAAPMPGREPQKPGFRSRYMNRNWTAKGRLPSGEMNTGEAKYAAHLEARKAAAEILWWKFEGLKFRLADNSFYTPDFNVMLPDGQIECHEIKGLWEANARTKIKVVAELYPFRFVALKARAKKHGGGWEEEEF